MAAGIWKKLKNAVKNVGGKIKDLATKAIKSIPKVINTGKKIFDKVKPALEFIPGVNGIVDTIDKGLNYADKFGKIGKSIIDEVK